MPENKNLGKKNKIKLITEIEDFTKDSSVIEINNEKVKEKWLKLT